MNVKYIRQFFVVFCFLHAQVVSAQVSMPKLFNDHMVLQRGTTIPVWGTAGEGMVITVALAGYQVSTVTGREGKWMVRLPELEAGGSYDMSIYEGENPDPVIRFTDILIGDVWLATGQSNMEWSVQQSMNATTEIKHADYPEIRFFRVPHEKTLKPQDDITGGSWNVCDSIQVKEASAVAYYFARQLHQDLNVPIGILQSTWGGTPVEAWTSREMLLSSEITRQLVLQNDTVTVQHFVRDSLDLIRFWEIVYNPQNQTDQLIPGLDFNDTSWPDITMPKTFKDWNMPFYEGIVWMRKTVSIPESMTGKDLTVYLGHPEMNYSMYFNGEEICKTIWNAARTHHYTIPANLVKPEHNVISARLAVLWGGGGFNPPAEEMYLTDGNTRISLAGTWKYQKDQEPRVPKLSLYHIFPTYLYNAMINPLIPYGIKGFIWYQGENNVDNAMEYQALFPMLINDWRIRWRQGYLPFLYVQLANYMKIRPDPSESDWAELREAQTLTLSQPNTGMACIIDIGEADDIHPKNKQEVGRRLALQAKKVAYGRELVASGPMYRGHEIMGEHIRIRFSETGSGLTTRDNAPVEGFAIAGTDRQFHWATARIDGDEVIVYSDKVKNPVAIRYAWADNPVATLVNKEGLPAVPFRTDTWTMDKESTGVK